MLNNDVTLSGFVVTDPMMAKDAPRKICTFFLETSKTWTEQKPGSSEKVRKERFEQHCIVALDKQCEAIMKMAKIGTEMTVKGELTYSRFVDQGDIERVRAEVVISGFLIHGLRKYKADGAGSSKDGMPWAGERKLD